MSYTKGPWKVISFPCPGEPKEVVMGVGVEIKTGYNKVLFNTILPETDEEYIKEHDEIKANAQLIAAAPYLLEALQDLVAKYDTLKEVGLGVIPEYMNDLDAARSLIANTVSK